MAVMCEEEPVSNMTSCLKCWCLHQHCTSSGNQHNKDWQSFCVWNKALISETYIKTPASYQRDSEKADCYNPKNSITISLKGIPSHDNSTEDTDRCYCSTLYSIRKENWIVLLLGASQTTHGKVMKYLKWR